jgi:hypothetical protein
MSTAGVAYLDSALGSFPPETVAPGITASNPIGSGANDLSSLVTDLATAAQVGLGLYNQTQGGPVINPATGKPAATTIAGFSLTTIFIVLVLIAGVIFAVRYATK